jgi:hypothetical protein
VALFVSPIDDVSLVPSYSNTVAAFYMVVEGLTEVDYSTVFSYLLLLCFSDPSVFGALHDEGPFKFLCAAKLSS